MRRAMAAAQRQKVRDRIPVCDADAGLDGIAATAVPTEILLYDDIRFRKGPLGISIGKLAGVCGVALFTFEHDGPLAPGGLNGIDDWFQGFVFDFNELQGVFRCVSVFGGHDGHGFAYPVGLLHGEGESGPSFRDAKDGF